VYELLLAAFRALNTSEERPTAQLWMLTLGFFWKLMAFLGFQPRLGACPEIPGAHQGAFLFSVRRGGILCTAHRDRDPHAHPLTEDDRSFLRSLLAEPLTRLVTLSPRPASLDRVSRITEDYRLTHTDGEPLRALRWFADSRTARAHAR
jgi:recombinational DNA repair protein (RecF pathway)